MSNNYEKKLKQGETNILPEGHSNKQLKSHHTPISKSTTIPPSTNLASLLTNKDKSSRKDAVVDSIHLLESNNNNNNNSKDPPLQQTKNEFMGGMGGGETNDELLDSLQSFLENDLNIHVENLHALSHQHNNREREKDKSLEDYLSIFEPKTVPIIQASNKSFSTMNNNNNNTIHDLQYNNNNNNNTNHNERLSTYFSSPSYPPPNSIPSPAAPRTEERFVYSNDLYNKTRTTPIIQTPENMTRYNHYTEGPSSSTFEKPSSFMKSSSLLSSSSSRLSTPFMSTTTGNDTRTATAAATTTTRTPFKTPNPTPYPNRYSFHNDKTGTTQKPPFSSSRYKKGFGDYDDVVTGLLTHRERITLLNALSPNSNSNLQEVPNVHHAHNNKEQHQHQHKHQQNFPLNEKHQEESQIMAARNADADADADTDTDTTRAKLKDDDSDHVVVSFSNMQYLMSLLEEETNLRGEIQQQNENYEIQRDQLQTTIENLQKQVEIQNKQLVQIQDEKNKVEEVMSLAVTANHGLLKDIHDIYGGQAGKNNSIVNEIQKLAIEKQNLRANGILNVQKEEDMETFGDLKGLDRFQSHVAFQEQLKTVEMHLSQSNDDKHSK